MAHYRAYMMAADRGTNEEYGFDAPDNLMTSTATKVVSAFFENVDIDPIPAGQLDYEVNAAFKRDTSNGPVVTAMGSLHLHGNDGPPMPFMLMISAAG